MAANTVNVGINVSDNGTVAELQKKLKSLNKEIKSVKDALKQTASGSAGYNGPSKQENIGYRNARGVAGTGGGDSRDFAKQAQGLGGLVHVYATFAANIFAVGAAFTALSKAQANANMLASADALSSTLGVNVKVLASDVQKLTGYTLSFQDSIKAVNVGLQSGISSKNLKELVVIAKGAANVMGRDVTDSIDRVIRGTAKQEQEILDELGIIIRSKQAWDEYAKTLGKSGAEALTAAEKQEGYTQAVIKAGQKQKEFANLFANPYDKLLASITEVGNAMLAGVNTIFGPIANFLAGNKAAIFSIISALTAFLLTKAIPTLRVIGDNLAEERDKNLANSKKLVDSYAKQGTLFNEKERSNIQSQLGQSTKDFDSYATKVKATFASIASSVSKSNIELRKSLKMDPTELGANAEKLTKQIDRSIRGLRAAASNASAGTGIFKNMGQGVRDAKALELSQRALELEKQRDTLLVGEQSHLSKINSQLQTRNALEARSNALLAEGGAISIKAQAAIDAINLKRDLRTNTLNQSQKFADVLNNPISTIGEKTSTFFGGFGQAGKAPSVVGEEGPLQPKKVSMFSAGVEKATYGFQALSLAGEAVIGVLGKVFIWFTILTTVWSGIEALAKATGLWTDKTSKLEDATKNLTDVLDTQNKTFEKQHELLTATDLDTSSYISKWKLLAESYAQATEKLKELKVAQDSMEKGNVVEKTIATLNPFGQSEMDRAYQIKKDLEDTLKKPGINVDNKAEIRAYLERQKVASTWNGLLKEGFDILIKVNSESAKTAEANKVLMKSFEGLGDAANEAYGKVFDKKVHTGFASEIGETLNKQLISPLDNLVERYKSGAISQEAFANGVRSFTSEMEKVGPGLKSTLPAFEEYLKALIVFESILNTIKTAKPGEELEAATTKAAAAALKAMDAKPFKEAFAKLKDAQSALDKQTRALETPKEASRSGLSQADRSEARSMADKIKVISAEIKTSDALLKDATSMNSRIAAVRGYNTELELMAVKQLDSAKVELEYSKSKKQAELDYFKIIKDVGSTKEAKDDALISKTEKLSEASEQQSLSLKAVNDQYNSSAIDNYIKKNNILLELFNGQINSAEKMYNNLDKLGKLSSKDKINVDAGIRDARDTAKFNTDMANLDAKFFMPGNQISYAVYAAEKVKLQNEYNDKLRESVDLKSTEEEIDRRNKREASLNNDISAIQSIMDIERERGVISIKYLNERMAAEEALFNEKMDQAANDPEKQRNLEIERGNRLYREQLELLEARKRNFSTLSTTDQAQTVYDEAAKRANDFAANMKDTVTGVFDAVYSGMDAAIDDITTKMMTGTKIKLKEVLDLFRNTVAEGFREMAAEQMKSSARNMIRDIMGKVLPGVDMRNNEEKALDYAKRTAEAVERLAGTSPEDTLKGIAGMFGKDAPGMEGQTAFSMLPLSAKLESNTGFNMNSVQDNLDNAKSSAEYFATATDEAGNSLSSLGDSVPSIFSGISDSFGSLFGSEGVVMNLLGGLGSGISGIFDGIMGMFSGGGGGFDIGGLLSQGMDFLSSFSFANGGIMSEYGALKLNKYASGGIANSPQMALFGEGRMNEAYVPLPDGRTIPVTMQGNTGGGNGPISVVVNVDAKGNADAQTTGTTTAQDAKQLGLIISSKVREEIVNQQRSGGLLNKR